MLGHSDDEDSTMGLAMPVSEFTHKDTSSQVDTTASGPCFSLACDSCVVGAADETMVDISCHDTDYKVDDQPPLQFITVSSGISEHMRKKVRHADAADYSFGDLSTLQIEPLSLADREAMRKLLIDLKDDKQWIEMKNRANVDAPKQVDTLKMVELYRDPVTGQRKAKVHKLDEDPVSKAAPARKGWLRRLQLIRVKGASMK